MSLRDEIDQFNKHICERLLESDLEGVLDCFTDDARLLAPGSDMVRGKSSLREWWSAFMAMPLKSVSMTTDHLVLDEPERALEIGRYQMNFETPDGLVSDNGKYSVLFRRGEDGKIRYEVDALNSSVPTS